MDWINRMRSLIRSLIRSLYWALYLLTTLLISLFLAWMLLGQVDFLYPVWYRALAIDRHVAVYAPQNRQRPHFQLTDRSERERLFTELVTAVHSDGRGLEELRYHTPSGRPLGRFLTEPEIAHLRDVAGLIRQGQRLGGAAIGIWLLWSVRLMSRSRRPPLGRMAVSLVCLLAVVGVVIVVTGPTRLFYAWHEWLFPPERPWFFYYQESLLTTLLKAPDLFGAIGAVWTTLALILSVLALGAVRWLAHRRPAHRRRSG
jgi:hypothetical protein